MSLKYVHFIGCGGAGTQPLALIFHEQGYLCSGSDLIENNRTAALKTAGVTVAAPGHRRENLPAEANAENALVVFSSAATDENPELQEARERGIRTVRRGEALAIIAKRFPVTIAVGGSHGKTSVTSSIVHILNELGVAPGYLIGGNLCGNAPSGTAGAGKIFVSEVDESDSTIACFHASLGVVTNVEDDHSWSVGGVENLFASFRTFAANAERLLYVPGENPDRLFQEFAGKSVCMTGIPAAIQKRAGWGGFQRENAAMAVKAVSMILPEIPVEKIIEAMLTFSGVERRMTLRKQNEKYLVIEDYAHHPTELAASISAFRENYPDKRLVIVFQPHRYARLQRYFDEFKAVLSRADRIFITPVFAAWTADAPVNSHTLAEAIGEKATALDGDWAAIGSAVKKELQENDVTAVIGAGDLPEIFQYL
ncbi:MAG: hypothetical protein E7040_05145 [Lentisphaerae bacterium]|nr:hypothetical protein [Lentisphaerota bacterium]